MTVRSIPRNLALFCLPALPLLLSACVSSSSAVPGARAATTARPAVRQPSRTVARDPQFHMEPGLEGVIGADQAQLIRQFGQPRLDVWEGDARKLQFTGTPCILDVYLYPTSRSREPVATYVDARRTDGRDVDKGACARALKR